MLISAKSVLTRANEIYVAKKFAKHPDLGFRAPELLPAIQSDQVLSTIEAIVEAINHELSHKVCVKIEETGEVYP